MFYDNFVKLCADKGQKPTPTAKEIGFSSAALVKWKNGTIPRDTRHTTATLLHAAWVDPYIVKRILGHASQDVTEAVYTHISDEQLREAIDKI